MPEMPSTPLASPAPTTLLPLTVGMAGAGGFAVVAAFGIHRPFLGAIQSPSFSRLPNSSVAAGPMARPPPWLKPPLAVTFVTVVWAVLIPAPVAAVETSAGEAAMAGEVAPTTSPATAANVSTTLRFIVLLQA